MKKMKWFSILIFVFLFSYGANAQMPAAPTIVNTIAGDGNA